MLQRSRRLKTGVSTMAFKVGLRCRPRGHLTRLGTAYGGWAVPTEIINSSWVCYTAGVGEDASFDVALAEMGCDVLAIDPTPRAIEYMKPLLAEHTNLKLAPYALWTHDIDIEFFPPANASHVSFSVTNRQHTSMPLRVPARTITSIATEFGHGRIDLLKLDIEGAEYPVLSSLNLGVLGVRVLCVEYHNDYGFWEMRKAARSIMRQGYQVSAVNKTDVTFRRI
jgi:FkbM family methyltransferase